MFIDVPVEEAAIIVELIDHNQAIATELPQLYRGVAVAFAELGMPLELPDARETPFVVRRGLEQLREKYAAVAESRDFDVHQAQLRTLLRHVREPRTLEQLAQHTDIPADELGRKLHTLEAFEHVRQLKDGHGTITWEITALGENQL